MPSAEFEPTTLTRMQKVVGSNPYMANFVFLILLYL